MVIDLRIVGKIKNTPKMDYNIHLSIQSALFCGTDTLLKKIWAILKLFFKSQSVNVLDTKRHTHLVLNKVKVGFCIWKYKNHVLTSRREARSFDACHVDTLWVLHCKGGNIKRIKKIIWQKNEFTEQKRRYLDAV